MPIPLLALAVAACGGAARDRSAPGGTSLSADTAHSAHAAVASTRRESLAAPLSGDGDGDSPERTAFDGDDFHSMHFGHAAGVADSGAITAIVKRYYSALAGEDATTVCSLLLEVVAESLPEGHNGQTNPASGVHSPPEKPSAGGDEPGACAAAVSGVLAENHRSLLAESRTLRVIGVRVRRRRASAILRFGGTSARHILLYKEGGSWKIGTLADEDLG